MVYNSRDFDDTSEYTRDDYLEDRAEARRQDWKEEDNK